MNNRRLRSPLTLTVTHVYLPQLVIPEGQRPHHWNECCDGLFFYYHSWERTTLMNKEAWLIQVCIWFLSSGDLHASICWHAIGEPLELCCTHIFNHAHLFLVAGVTSSLFVITKLLGGVGWTTGPGHRSWRDTVADHMGSGAQGQRVGGRRRWHRGS